MLRVLIVEDSASMRSFVRAALESEPAFEDLEVVEAGSGFDALRLLPRDSYDLVITDINMPDINGLELLQFIRKQEKYQALPVLLISTQKSERDRERGLKLGANGYLAKPFSPEALCEEVLTHLVRSGAQGAHLKEPREGEAPGGGGADD